MAPLGPTHSPALALWSWLPPPPKNWTHRVSEMQRFCLPSLLSTPTLSPLNPRPTPAHCVSRNHSPPLFSAPRRLCGAQRAALKPVSHPCTPRGPVRCLTFPRVGRGQWRVSPLPMLPSHPLHSHPFTGPTLNTCYWVCAEMRPCLGGAVGAQLLVDLGKERETWNPSGLLWAWLLGMEWGECLEDQGSWPSARPYFSPFSAGPQATSLVL